MLKYDLLEAGEVMQGWNVLPVDLKLFRVGAVTVLCGRLFHHAL
jgi:hypothetical protein